MNARLFRDCLVFVFLTSSPVTAFGQSPLRNTQFDAAAAALQPLAQRPVSEGRMILGGLLGGAIGFFGGGFAGALINDGEGDEDDLDALTGFAVGAVIGETLLLPLGVHVANRRQGNLGLSLLASSAITAAGLAIATAGEDHLEYLIPLPALQLVSSVIVEKRTSR